ncbi:thioredoxin family protein [Pseudomonas sp. MBLB4123]|uniref:thioredoxin family protein n=1 Tax=Pseudomonas sp. MBLB4123 TaxID=3451557 RepID=UPI003F74E242
MKVELLQLSGCSRCGETRDDLQEEARRLLGAELEWREVDALAELDYAVELGVLSLPALAIDGQLAFASLPTPAQLAAELRRRLGARRHGA